MPSSHLRRPSGAMLVALLALFVALGSGAYATTAINGKIIQKRTIVGSKLKNNTLTGTQINESTLGTVPQATQADSATTAATAATATKATSATTAATATTATSATNAVNATNASNATTATNAQQLGGLAAGNYLHGFHMESLYIANSLTTKEITVACPSGEVAVGGGGANTAATGKVAFDKLKLTPTSYEVVAFVLPGQTEGYWQLEAEVMCAIP